MRRRQTLTCLLAGTVVLFCVGIRADGAAAGEETTATQGQRSEKKAEAGAEARAFDGFDGRLGLQWKPLRRDPTHVSLTKSPGMLIITTQHGSIHLGAERNRQRGTPAAKNIYLVDNPLPGGPGFVVTTCLDSFRPDTPYQQAGLIVFSDEENYLKWVCESSNSGVPVLNLLREVEASSSIKKLPLQGKPGRLWLRLTGRGNHYRFASSTDGKSYTVHGELPWGDGPPKQIGILAKNGGSRDAAEMDARFDFFEVRPLTAEELSDPAYVDRRGLQGAWEVTACRINGELLEKAPLSKFVFTGDRLAVSEGQRTIQTEYVLDAAKQPRQLLLSGLLGSSGRSVRAVYSLQADELVICIDPRPGAPAPGELETKQGDGRMLIELKRIKQEK